jgi:TPR repeat protein
MPATPEPVERSENAGVARASPRLPILARTDAESRFHQAREMEHQGDLRGAFQAYQQAAQSGNGPAQKKLGDMYGTGNEVIERDYQSSLRWYGKAREHGIEVRKPFSYPGVRRQ